MWKMTTLSIESINKPITRRNVHPEMEDIKSGEELQSSNQKTMMKMTLLLLENDSTLHIYTNITFPISVSNYNIISLDMEYIKDSSQMKD